MAKGNDAGFIVIAAIVGIPSSAQKKCDGGVREPHIVDCVVFTEVVR